MSERVREYISQEKVEARIQEIADRISAEYAGRQVHIIGILKGSVFFMCSLTSVLTVFL